MKKALTILSLSLLLLSCGSSTKTIISNNQVLSSPIHASIDLTKVTDDKVPVTIDPGRFDQDTIIYRIPKVIQGTYTVSDFGKYIEDFKVFDYVGNEMAAAKIDENSWAIGDAANMDKLTYWVNDTFDEEVIGGIGQKVPFSPAGTNIEPDNFVLNLHGFIGYFDSFLNNQYKLNIKSPATFVRTSALKETGLESGPLGRTIKTSYDALRYFDITDNPMMFGNLDVEEFQVGDIKIVLSVYSPNKVHTASSIKNATIKMMEAQKKYLGDLNSTPTYHIFLYLSSMGEGAPKGFGALEHHRSTMVVFPENSPAEALAQSMTDVVSHEFFHIVAPLTLHSEDIHYFDYNDPTFSKHLWMYEGLTEYFANHFQINQGLINEDEFYSRIINKIQTASYFDDSMSFIEMSENVLEEPYSKNYINVYQKGALIGMCLDILIREGSNGNRGILSLIKELSMKYGINKPFDDDKIIDEISAMTYPGVGEFFKDHVIGKIPINYKEFFNKVGLEIMESKVETNYIMNDGAVILKPDMATGTIAFSKLVEDNSFWSDLGVIEGDIIKEINGDPVNLQNAQMVFTKVYMWQPGMDIEVKLERNDEELIINTKTVQSYTTGLSLAVSKETNEAKDKLRKAWLKG